MCRFYFRNTSIGLRWGYANIDRRLINGSDDYGWTSWTGSLSVRRIDRSLWHSLWILPSGYQESCHSCQESCHSCQGVCLRCQFCLCGCQLWRPLRWPWLSEEKRPQVRWLQLLVAVKPWEAGAIKELWPCILIVIMKIHGLQQSLCLKELFPSTAISKPSFWSQRWAESSAYRVIWP